MELKHTERTKTDPDRSAKADNGGRRILECWDINPATARGAVNRDRLMEEIVDLRGAVSEDRQRRLALALTKLNNSQPG